MKNIYLIPTDKARLYIHQGKLYDNKKNMHIPDGTTNTTTVLTLHLMKKLNWFFLACILVDNKSDKLYKQRFAFWLQGYFEVANPNEIGPKSRND